MNSIKNIFTLAFSVMIFVSCTAQDMQQNNTEDLSTDVITQSDQEELTPEGIIQGLKEGNERYVNNNLTPRNYQAQVEATSDGQYPEAIVISCVDSRVPVETVFDKGVGDIFVARVAGNFANEDILGSSEFATAVAGSKVFEVPAGPWLVPP